MSILHIFIITKLALFLGFNCAATKLIRLYVIFFIIGVQNDIQPEKFI